ncbi:copper chaperone PCu(A)C [Qipengyuania sp. MTN3-11]|uniref:copper chaperone PCu(A)C n=1 Tax=Qipengyuania sp. MTN3-11 TaxID=3056557 RepID=UPI0036F42839
MSKQFSIAAALSLSCLAIAACSSEPEETAVSAEEGIPGLSISNARLMLPPVAGNPAAIYMDIAYDGERGVAIRSVDVADAARAELHDVMEYDFEMTMMEMPGLTLQPGDRVSFEPGGKHVMAFELSPELQAGGTTEVTFTIAGGDKQSFDVPVMAAGEER